jgi:hypothetical protein
MEPVPAAPAPSAEPAPPEASTAPSGEEEPTTNGAVEEDPERTAARERIVAAARRLLGTHPKLDCSGFVLAAYRAAGLQVTLDPASGAARNRSVALLETGSAPSTPRPGDLAFFHDTFDRNRNGRVDDGITHVALVETVDGDRVTLLHRGRRVERMRMDLGDPSSRAGNDQVRIRRTHDRRGTLYLSGELFVAFGGLLDGAVTQTLPVSRPEDTGAGEHARRWSRNGSSSGKARGSRSTPPPASSSSARAASSESSRSTRRSSSRSSGSGAPGARSSPAP